MSVDIDSANNINPGTIFDDIQEYIEDQNLEGWAVTEQDDEADDIIDDDDQDATKNKHIRLTIPQDKIDGAEEREVVKGFDSETVVEIKFFKVDETKTRVMINAIKGDI